MSFASKFSNKLKWFMSLKIVYVLKSKGNKENEEETFGFLLKKTKNKYNTKNTKFTK